MINFIFNKKMFCYACLMSSVWVVPCLAAPVTQTSFEDVAQKARTLAQEPFVHPNDDELSDALKKIGYDEWRDLRFNPEKILWAGEPFSVQFFHPGFIYQDAVMIHTVNKNHATPIPFSSDFFDYTQSTSIIPPVEATGFAGFRVHYPINTPAYADEIISFLGASYFRALGKDLAYGISARGLAIDTAEPSGEEFPFFREFWIIHPSAKEKEISFYALLDSESLTGAYNFIVRPGDETLVKVKGVLFFRKKIKKLGLAPLTSMFFYAENTGFHPGTDFRPEIHDSDGLLINEQSGEWTWHPLVNPENLLINSFMGGQPLGFGLIQRDTNFDHYQDLEARYDRRPSVWILPGNDWNPGHLELLQIPTENEYNDNIGAYWVMDKSFDPGDSFAYDYTMIWHAGNHKRSTLATVEATRIVAKPDNVMFIIDFVLDRSQEELSAADVSANIDVFNDYVVTSSQIIKNTVTNGWRLVIHVDLDQENFLDKVRPGPKPAVELRAFLKHHDIPITETWSYTYLP